MKSEQNSIQLYLAPMEGVVDYVLRNLLTQVGGIDFCTTEFLRVTDKLYPDHVFYKNCPELTHESRTLNHTPVILQLLGGHPEPMARNALRAVELGAIGIDINFGCPAKTVNKHDGGAALLKSCHRLYDIAQAIRKSVPKEIPVSAKIRLGYEDPSSCLENSLALQESGIQKLTVHCRTKLNGYTPPAYWEWIPKIKEKIHIPIVANGEIWNVEDFKRCHDICKVQDYMIGRGALSDPFIFLKIKNYLNAKNHFELYNWKNLVSTFYESAENFKAADFAVARTKQWLKSLSLKNEEARIIFDELKKITLASEFKLNLKKVLTSESTNIN